MKINIFWFRRDLRLNDNAGLYRALKNGEPVLPIFIFDKNILDILEDRDDARVTFIHDTLVQLKTQLESLGTTLHVFYDTPIETWKRITQPNFFGEGIEIGTVYTNHDYEKYAIQRDSDIKSLLNTLNIEFKTYKDHVIFEYQEVVKDGGKPYTVFTPYSRKWRAKLESRMSEKDGTAVSYYLKPYPTETYFNHFFKVNSDKTTDIPSLESMNFKRSNISIPSATVARSVVKNYDKTRNFPALSQGTSKLGIHFRFGTISIREKALAAQSLNDTYLNELIWRDFYSQILQHFPHISENKAFRAEYDLIQWRDDASNFEKWCAGKTGYPIVDAGMRELNATGYMHNRVRMIVSSFLTKHLLLDWRLGEAYFAKKLLDFDFSSNNGGWQWASGSGTDAAPYFRIFNPLEQQKKFDAEFKYIRRWVPEWDTPQYPKPIVDHKMARERCLATYAAALKKEG